MREPSVSPSPRTSRRNPTLLQEQAGAGADEPGFEALRSSIVANAIALGRGLEGAALYSGQGWDELRFWVRLGAAIRRGEFGPCQDEADQRRVWAKFLTLLSEGRFDDRIAGWSRAIVQRPVRFLCSRKRLVPQEAAG